MLICPKCHSANYDGKYCNNCGYGKFIRQPQEVIITWYPYPEHKPKVNRIYFTSLKSVEKPTYKFVETKGVFFGAGGFQLHCYPINVVVDAFAELPKGYKEEK